MPLQLPSEVIVEDVLPTLRVELATELGDAGLTQREIADRLGVSQAAVSKYASGDAPTEPLIAEHPRTRATVERIAEGLASGEMDDYDALAEVLELVRAFEDRGPICELHERAMPALDGLGCDLCVRGPDEAVRAERDAIASVRRAARRLAGEPAMAPLVPNVGTNVATALPGAEDETEVAAVPGRLLRMRGRVEVPANPEFGASRNVATVVLAASTVDSSLRGAVNLAVDEALLTAARTRGIDPLEFDPDYEGRRERLEATFRERERVPRVCFHRGDFGVEPVLYVLGETAVEAVELAIDLGTAEG